MIRDKDDGVTLVADIMDCSYILPSDVCGNLRSISSTKEFDLERIKLAVDYETYSKRGLSFYDIHIIDCVIDILSENIGNRIKVTEFGCGTSTRLFSNSKNVSSLNTYALEDAIYSSAEDKTIDFVECDLTNNAASAAESANSSDLLFIDCNHSYNFAEFYCNEILNKIENVVVIIHDFLPVSPNKFFANTWGEQFYILHEFLPKQNRYSLYTYTAISDEEVLVYGDVDLMACREDKYSPLPCICVLLPETYGDKIK